MNEPTTHGVTFTRCPTCGAIDWRPSFPAVHRPRCPQTDTDTDTDTTDWSTT